MDNLDQKYHILYYYLKSYFVLLIKILLHIKAINNKILIFFFFELYKMEFECMICAESNNIGPLYKPCNCNTVVHKECLLRLINVNTHQKKCPICLKEYNIIVISKKKIYNCEKQGLIFFILFYFLSILIIIFFIFVILLYLSNFYSILLLSLLCSIFSLVPIMFIHYFYYTRTRRLCCITTILKLERHLNLPPPIKEVENKIDEIT